MKILLVNAGSSSLKYQLLDMKTEKVVAKGNCEKIGLAGPFITFKANGKEMKFDGAKNHEEAISKVLEILTNKEYGVLKSLDEIDAVGHRVLHGGEIYTDSVLITPKVMKDLDKLVPLGPLHMPANIAGIKACQAVMSVPQIAVFDTAFHATMPEEAYMYPIKYEDAKKFKIRKYGFHGSSHKYITGEMAKILGKPQSKLNLIIAHCGNGSSITAVVGGKSIDTTMGLTPLQGLMMGTRSGDVEPTVVQYLCEKKNMTVEKAISYLNKQCGLIGISGYSSDNRELTAKAAEGDERCILSLNMLAHSIKKNIASFLPLMDRVDAIVFTGGIGENSLETRESVMTGFEHLGICIDKKKNRNFKRGEVQLISTAKSNVKIYIVPTNEELLIARDTKKIVSAIAKKNCSKCAKKSK